MRVARACHFLLVGWLLACVGLIVPAHNGAHAHAPVDEAHSHGHHDGHHDGHRDEHHDHHPGESDDAAHCSICQFAAGLTRPVLVDVNVQPPQLVEIVATAEPVSPASRPVILPFHGRAPPGAL